jgi:hypothetical protein
VLRNTSQRTTIFCPAVKLGLELKELRLVGGGSKNKLWQQIVSDVFQLPVRWVDGLVDGHASSLSGWRKEGGARWVGGRACMQFVWVREGRRVWGDEWVGEGARGVVG